MCFGWQPWRSSEIELKTGVSAERHIPAQSEDTNRMGPSPSYKLTHHPDRRQRHAPAGQGRSNTPVQYSE